MGFPLVLILFGILLLPSGAVPAVLGIALIGIGALMLQSLCNESSARLWIEAVGLLGAGAAVVAMWWLWDQLVPKLSIASGVSQGTVVLIFGMIPALGLGRWWVWRRDGIGIVHAFLGSWLVVMQVFAFLWAIPCAREIALYLGWGPRFAVAPIWPRIIGGIVAVFVVVAYWGWARKWGDIREDAEQELRNRGRIWRPARLPQVGENQPPLAKPGSDPADTPET